MKLLDGSPGPWYVSRVTATPRRPAKPSPPPPPPMLCGVLPDASSSAKVSPSAPLPPPICAVNEAVSPLPGNGLENTAEPVWLAVAEVRTTVEPLAAAEPLNTQPPAPSAGTGLPLVGLMALPVTATLCAPCPSFELIVYCPVKVPAADGENVTCTCTESSGPMTCPSGSGVFTTNGRFGGAAFVTVTFRLPLLETVSVLVTDWPTGTVPKSSEPGEMTRLALPVTPMPLSVAVPVPSGPATEIIAVSVVVAVGA